MTVDEQASPGEFELIARYFDRPMRDPSILLGPGDDAALVEPAMPLAVATDTLVENVHFLSTIDPRRLGHRVLAVNLSDMAAMGARPRWFTLALTIPRVDTHWLESFSAGLHACAETYDVALVGGDVTAGPLCLSVHIVGEVPPEQALRRSGASPGDAVFVTGTLGDAAAGLEILRQPSFDAATVDDDERVLIDRHELPTPRVAAGIALRGLATAAIDISDGLLNDLGWICRGSGCGAVIDVERLPLSGAMLNTHSLDTARALALRGGDDYELCFAVSVDREERIAAVFADLDVPATRIGTFTAGGDVRCLLDGECYEPRGGGYEHFR